MMTSRIFGVFLLLMLFPVFPCSAAEEGTGVITGSWITKKYGPMAGAQVLLFDVAKGPAPASHKYLRLPDAGAPVDADGKFQVRVPAGKYYLVMRKRLDPASAGPPQEGDPQYYARLRNGKPKVMTVRAGKTTNVGKITEAIPYHREKVVIAPGTTGIEGVVADDQGHPVAGVRVLAYDSAGMVGMPRYASDMTGKDGKYFLLVNEPGSYYLKIRTHYGGGRPAEGELMGTFEQEGKPAPVRVEKGSIVRGIDIRGSGFSSKREE